MENIKLNAITNQKKIIMKIRENFGSELLREKVIEKLNLIVDDYEKDNDIIDKDNIYLYYEFMNDEDLEKYSCLLSDIFNNRLIQAFKNLSFSSDQIHIFLCKYTLQILSKDRYIKSSCIFGTKDTLKPIDEYIADIKESEAYKEYLAKKS